MAVDPQAAILAMVDRNTESYISACRAGVPFSTVEVRFQDLNVGASVYMGNRALPTVTNAYRNGFEVGI